MIKRALKNFLLYGAIGAIIGEIADGIVRLV